MFPLAVPQKTLRVSGKQNSLFPLGLVIKCLLSTWLNGDLWVSYRSFTRFICDIIMRTSDWSVKGTLELDVLVLKFHGFVTGLEVDPHTTLSAYCEITKQTHVKFLLSALLHKQTSPINPTTPKYSRCQCDTPLRPS